MGDSLIPVALAFAVIGIHGQGLGLGIVLACRTIAIGSSTVAGGAWADRLPRRTVMISADLLRLDTEAVTAVLLVEGTAHVWQLAVLQSVAGVGSGFFSPASTAPLPQAVSPGRLQQTNSLLSTSQSATNIFGPAVSGAIVAAAGPGWCFAIDAASFLVSVAFMSRDAGRGARTSRPAPLADGRLPRLIYLALGPFVVDQHLGGKVEWGLILAAMPVGGVLRGLVAYRIRPQPPVATAFAIWSLCGVLPFALVRPFPLPVVIVTAADPRRLIGNALWDTARQQTLAGAVAAGIGRPRPYSWRGR